MKKKILAALLMGSMVLSLITGCGNTAGSNDESEKTAAEDSGAGENEESQKEEKDSAVTEGGTLRIVTKARITSIGCLADNPMTHDLLLSGPAIETLGRMDENGKVEPWLAEEFTVDEEAKTILIKLKEGIKFHDGTDFNADAVCANIKIYKDTANANYGSLTSCEAVSDYEVLLHFDELTGYTLEQIAVAAGQMISPAFFDENGYDGCVYKSCGTGPYKLVSADDTHISYIRNDEYWIEDAVYLDGIEVILCADDMTAVNILRAGDADVIYAVTTENASNLLKEEGFKRVGSSEIDSPQAFEVIFNSANEQSPFSKVEVRQAFCHALDIDAISEALGYGFYVSTNQMAAPGSALYCSEVAGYEYNPEKTKELLTQAGYPDGCDVTLNYSTPNEKAMVMVQDYLGKAGFNVTMNLMDGAMTNEAVQNDGDQTFEGVMISYMPVSVLSMYSAYGKNCTQISGRMDPDAVQKLKEYYDIMYTSMDDAEVKEAGDSFQKLLIDEACLMQPFYTYTTLVIARENVQDTGLFSTSVRHWTPEKAWIEQ